MSKKLTIEKFIERAREKHGDRYSYALVNYINNSTKVKITCPIHGIFEQTPNSHTNGNGCPACVGLKRHTNSTFIDKAKRVHGDKYSYDLVEYINIFNSVKIVCPIHGMFEQRPNDHITGYGCPECGGSKKSNTEQFIDKAKRVHGDKYSYDLVEYVNNRTKVVIICPIHGKFIQVPNNHLNGQGCYECAKITISVALSSNTEQFIDKAKRVHGNKYNYNLVEYMGATRKIKIVCLIHGVFEQIPNSHLSGKRCPECAKKNNQIKK